MNIEWNYGYYQPQSDNEWLVDEMFVELRMSSTKVGETHCKHATFFIAIYTIYSTKQ